MKYSVEVSPVVMRAIRAQAFHIAQDKPIAAERWLGRVLRAIDGLESMPRRHAISHLLSDSLGVEIRNLIIDRYKLFFLIDDRKRVVRIVLFRHGSQRL
ncbi:MAG: hypothetical protein AMXMBFR47_05300 [Planctomycetota bacterium]